MYLIHMLAKQETPMKVSKTVLGRVPARLRTRVIRMRSMLVLLRAEDIVNPPMSNIIVGENITEKTYLLEQCDNKYPLKVDKSRNVLCRFRR